jgi:hypothetical protein
MSVFLLIIVFFSGMVLLLAIGRFIGHILRLDKYLEGNPENEVNERV